MTSIAATEHYLHFIKQLFGLANDNPASHVHIQSFWVVESPNHGDAGILNKAVLDDKSQEFGTKCMSSCDAARNMNRRLRSSAYGTHAGDKNRNRHATFG